MATTTEAGIVQPAAAAQRSLTAFIDRWIYVMMAALILTLVLIGFIPDSINMLGKIKAGTGLPIPPILHVHAVLMGSWILLLLTQATLMATGRRGPHMQLGMIALVLAPAIVIAGLMLVPTRHAQIYAAIASAPPEVAAYMQQQVVPLVTNIMLAQIRIGVLFPIFVGLALYYRNKDSETHKRLLILATISPMPAAMDRITYIPTTLPESPLTMDLYVLMIAAPLILWDLYRGRVNQRAYLIWFGLMVPTAIAMNLLWGSPWWMETGPKLIGAN